MARVASEATLQSCKTHLGDKARGSRRCVGREEMRLCGGKTGGLPVHRGGLGQDSVSKAEGRVRRGALTPNDLRCEATILNRATLFE